MAASNPTQGGKRQGTFTTFIEPHRDVRNRETVFKAVLAGTGIAMLSLFILLLVSFAILHNYYILGRVIIGGLVVLYIFAIWRLFHSRFRKVTPFLLVGFYQALAIGMVLQWGNNSPFGILLLGLSIVLASTLLVSSNALWAAGISCATVIGAQIGQELGYITPSPDNPPAEMGDAIGFCIGFCMLALVSWLFARQTERSLQRAEVAEKALLQEKAMLKVRVQERTEELRQAQMEELQQLHQFAEVGQLSTALLHDLANHLTVLTLEIEGIQSNKHTPAINRARHIIGHLDTMVHNVRERLRGKNSEHTFNLVAVINEIVEFNRYRNVSSPVTLAWETPHQRGEYQYFGDPLRLSQVVTIVVTNAIDAYAHQPPDSKKPAEVKVELQRVDAGYEIHITDHGKGISADRRASLFKEVASSKRGGMGLGLYLARQILESHFGGSIMLSPATDRTEFIISLPKKAA